MKKIYLIEMFDAKTLKYVATYKSAYYTKELAREQIKRFNNPHLIFIATKVDLVNEIDYIS